jgi:PAS domain S-box-containing protein
MAMAPAKAALSFRPEDVLSCIGQAVIATDLDGVVVYWNPAAEALYGWTAQEALGRAITTLTVPEVTQDVAADIIAALRDGISWSGGFLVRRRDGTRFPALVTDAGIRQDGALVGIVGISTNLGTALRPLLERSTDAALVLRSDAVVTYASPAVHRLFGWREDDVTGQSIVPKIHPDDRERLGRLIEQALQRPGAHPPVEFRVDSDDGWVWAEAALTNLLDDPIVRGVVCNMRRSGNSALSEARIRIEQLETALESRLIIELAKGFLMGQEKIDAVEAFERLRNHARRHHLALREVSRRVVEGELHLSRS